jgi:ABC-type oligopeptide transport system substrate-binding subunit
MTSKMPKQAFKIFLGVLMLTFFVAACNNSGEKKETPKDTTKVDTSIHGKPTDSGN